MCTGSASCDSRDSAAAPGPDPDREQLGSVQTFLTDQGEVEVVVTTSGEVLHVLQGLDE